MISHITMNIKKVFLTSRIPLFLLISLGLISCGSTNIAVYQQNQPTLNVESFFKGKLTAHGIVKNRSGEVIRYFNADLKGSWDNGVGLLEEEFLFDDGELDYRTWVLTPHADGGYVSTANDVTGSGHLQTSGNALFMKYILQVPYKDDVIEVHVDDRMYLVKDNVLMNESILTKFGFEVGSVSLVILKSE